MSNTDRRNGEYGTGAYCEGEGVMPGRCSVGEQGGPGRNQATARTTWTKEINKIVMECYFKSEPTKRGYRKRMLQFWGELGVFEVKEQRLADQARAIKTNRWLTDIEIEEIKRIVSAGQHLDASEMEEALPSQCQTESTNEDNEYVDWQDVQSADTQSVEEQILDRGLDEDEANILRVLSDKMKKQDHEPPQNLKTINKSSLKKEIDAVNSVLKHIETRTITETNKLLVVAANLVTERLGLKRPKEKLTKEPWWRRRIKTKIEQLRKDISRLERVVKGECTRANVVESLERKYKLSKKGKPVVLEELKQRVTAQAAKLKRYDNRITQFKQNRMFESNRKRLFEEIEGVQRDYTISPDKQESIDFWNGVWGQSVNYNQDAEWLTKIEHDLSELPQQEDIQITDSTVRKQLSQMANWKSPGPDGLQGFWLKNFTSLRVRISEQLNQCLQSKTTPDWMTKGRTVLILKDKEKGTIVTNFRPITCLPMMWKLLTGILAEELYTHLENSKLLPDEQKGCRKNSRGTKDQLLIDKTIIRNCKRRKTNLGVAWVDFKKAFDMVPHAWIIKCLIMVGAPNNLIGMLKSSMEKWKTVLTAANEVLGEIDVKRGIFQGDSLSPLLFVISMIPLTLTLRKTKAGYDLGGGQGVINHLLFMDVLKLYGKSEDQVDSLVQSVRIVSSDINMEFGISKCASLMMKRGKLSESKGIKMPDNKIIRGIEDPEDEYKYLGILEIDDIKHVEMKKGLKKEYYRRLRKILKSKLNGGNIIEAINSRAVSVIRYGAGIIEWTKEELQGIDRKTRKLLTIYRALHPQADVDRLYFKRKYGGRGLISVEDCVTVEINSMIKYLANSDEVALKAVQNENTLKAKNNGVGKKELREERRNRYLNKCLHGQYEKNTQEKDEKSWEWLKKGHLKKETEGLLMAAQDQALRTNSIRSKIDNQDVSPNCRMCGVREETISHIVSECSKLAQKYYKHWRHDKVAQIVHWHMCGMYGFERASKWYDHTPEPVLESETTKILWDFKIQTDKPLESNRPDITVLNKRENTCWIIDVACPFDTRVAEKEREKIEKYQDLRREMLRIWKCNTIKIIPIVIGALGSVSTQIEKWLQMIEMQNYFQLLQKACLLGSARILRKVIDLEW